MAGLLGEGATYHRQHLDPLLLPIGEFTQRQLQPLRLDPQARRQCMRRGHPDIRVRRILHLGSNCQTLQLCRQNIKHSLPRHKRRRPKRNRQLVPGTIIISHHLRIAFGYRDAIQRSHFRRGQFVQCSVDVPAVEPCYSIGFVLWGDAGFVECRVAWVFEFGFRESFVVVYSPVADELDLGYSRDGFEIGVEDGFLGAPGLVVPVAVAFGFRIECLKFILGIIAYIDGSCITFVNAYCCSGVRTTSRNKRASCCRY